MTRQVIELWFEFASNYSYLTVMRIEPIARQAGVTLIWRPFLLGAVFGELGMHEPPFVTQKEKGRYVWIDSARRAAKYGLPFNRPSEFPRLSVLPLRVALLGADEVRVPEFCRRIMHRNWVRDLEINSADAVIAALDGLVPDPESVLRAAQSDSAKQRLREQTSEAHRRGIFGAPTFLVGDEMFWGDDRLEDALHAALAQAGKSLSSLFLDPAQRVIADQHREQATSANDQASASFN